MIEQSIILFYKYVALKNPKEILKWQKYICQKLNLKGRIILAHEGINGTLGGLIQNLETYKDTMQKHELFSDIDFKESKNIAHHFPRLYVALRKEIVNLGIDPTIISADQAGIRLEPNLAHELIAQKKDDLIIIDCRNQVESAIGTIEGALRPAVNHFREFPEYIDTHLETLQDKQVLMFCTGGVRCERASAYIKSKGVAKEVFHIKGGIHRYVEQFPNGFFKGKNYVFDGRVAVKVTDDILGSCFICKKPCDDYTNCLRASCNRHFISCQDCVIQYQNTCSFHCHDLITNHQAPKRPHPVKTYGAAL